MARIRQRLGQLTGRVERARLRQWVREGGPGPVLRWSLEHPWTVTAAVALVLTVILGWTFGIPPLSPLLLVLVFVAPLPWWLRAEHRVYRRWLEQGSEDAPRRGDDA